MSQDPPTGQDRQLVSIIRRSSMKRISFINTESSESSDGSESEKDPRRMKIYNNKVFPPWYRRYEFALPEDQRINFQPPAEVDARNELLAMLFVWGEDWKEIVTEDPGKRYTAMKRYARYVEQQRKVSVYEASKIKLDRVKSVSSVKSVVKNFKKKTDLPNDQQRVVLVNVVSFLKKLQTRKIRAIQPKRSIGLHSKWRVLHFPIAKRKIHVMSVNIKVDKIRKRFKRIINLVRCVQRFIVNISILSGNTKQIFSTLVKFQLEQQEKLDKVLLQAKKNSKDKTPAMFNPKNYRIKQNFTISVSVRFTLTKPWFERKGKEIQEVVNSLQNLRSYVALPLNSQRLIAKAAWYMEIPEDKVIIRECHVAQDYYLVISGRCTICKLNGSPVESDKAGFRFIKHCFKGDVFGDESILDPGSLRTYSVISSTACEILAINIHDYHRMLLDNSDKEDEEELEPEHIRFLYHLHFLKDFPVSKISEEEDDGNLSVFYVEHNKLVCHSVKNSQFVYIIKYGRANLLIEKKPSEEASTKYQRLCDIWDYDTAIRTKRLGQDAFTSSRSSISSDYNRKSFDKDASNEDRKIRESYRLPIPSDVKEHLLKRIHRKDVKGENSLDHETKRSVTNYLNPFNDLLMPFGRKDMKFKRLTEMRRMPQRKTEKTVNTLKKRITEFTNTMTDGVPSGAQSLGKLTSAMSSRRSSIKSDVPNSRTDFNENTSFIRSSIDNKSQHTRTNYHQQSSTIRETIRTSASSSRTNLNASRCQPKHSARSLSYTNRADKKQMCSHSPDVLGYSLSQSNFTDSSLSIEASMCSVSDMSCDTPRNKLAQNANSNRDKPGISAEINSSNKQESQQQGKASVDFALEPLQIRATDVAMQMLVAGRGASESSSHMSDFKSIKPFYKAINPSVLMNSKEWSKFLVYRKLVKGDQAGFEWLDFKDTPFDPPDQDYALVSDGCELIMLKKDYILSKMKKFWMTEDMINIAADDEEEVATEEQGSSLS